MTQVSMQHFRTLAALSIVFFAGCTSHYAVDCDAKPSRAILSCADVQRRIAGEEVALLLYTGERIDAGNVHISADSVFFHDLESAGDSTLRTACVRTIELTNRYDGGLLGFFTGGLAGGLVFFAEGSRSSGGEMGGLREFSTLTGAFLGGVAGLTFGFLQGYRYDFDFCAFH